MKNTINFLAMMIFMVIGNNLSKAQWVLVDPPPTSYELHDIQLVSTSVGYAVAAGFGTLLKTIDGGATWVIQSSVTPDFFHRVRFTDENTGTVVGYNSSGGFILRTTNGGTEWITQASGLPCSLDALSFIDSNNGIVGGLGVTLFWGTILRTTDGGASWTYSNYNNNWQGNIISLFYIDSVNAYAVAQTSFSSSRILKSTDKGVTWYSVYSANEFIHLCMIDASNGVYVGDSGSIHYTTDGCQTWTSQSVPTTNDLLGVTFTDTNTMTVVGENGVIFRTTDGGQNWIEQFSGVTNTLYLVSFYDANSGLVAGEDDTILWTMNGGLPVELISFTSSINGNNVILAWQTATEINNKGFEIYRNGNKIAFVEGKGTTTERQNYSFRDVGLSTGLYNYRLNQIDYGGTQKIVGETTVNLILPEQFSLEQNYPNPFNPSTTIQYQLASSSHVSLKVYDVLGIEVTTLIDEVKSAGSYEVEFDASKLSSGIYFYKLQASSFVGTKKMILLH